MKTRRSFQPDLAYLKTLIGAGLVGVNSAGTECRGRIFTPPLQSALWKPAAIGATVGALGSSLKRKRKTSHIAVGSLVGSLVGLGVAVAWASRGFTGRAYRNASGLVNAARDAQWLKTHPINYA